MSTPKSYLAQIKVVGVGGAGGNAVNRMKEAGLKGVEFISINTDAQALMGSEADHKICVGTELTKGLGAGGDPEIGKQSAEMDKAIVEETLDGADMVFIAVGEGGGTGTGAAPVVAEQAKNIGCLTVAVVTRPFKFEGRHRHNIAEQGIRTLKDKVDALIIIRNENLSANLKTDITLEDAFAEADQFLLQSVQGVTDLITRPGLVNTDFADVKKILGDAGTALIGMGEASGEERASSAAKKAIANPLLEDSMQSARGIIINITSGSDPKVGLQEVEEAAEIITSMAHESANVIFGNVEDSSLGEKLRVTVISAGFTTNEYESDIDVDDILGSLDSESSGEFRDTGADDIDLPDFLK